MRTHLISSIRARRLCASPTQPDLVDQVLALEEGAQVDDLIGKDGNEIGEQTGFSRARGKTSRKSGPTHLPRSERKEHDQRDERKVLHPRVRRL
jgi:hypothetical protein